MWAVVSGESSQLLDHEVGYHCVIDDDSFEQLMDLLIVDPVRPLDLVVQSWNVWPGIDASALVVAHLSMPKDTYAVPIAVVRGSSRVPVMSRVAEIA